MQRIQNKIIISTLIPSQTLKTLSEKEKLTSSEIQSRFTKFILYYIRAYMYNLIYPLRNSIKVSYAVKDRIPPNIKVVTSLLNVVENSVFVDNVTDIVTVPPKITRKEGRTASINTASLYQKMMLYVAGTEKIMFSKFLLNSIHPTSKRTYHQSSFTPLNF